jgi:hypothetical protein
MTPPVSNVEEVEGVAGVFVSPDAMPDAVRAAQEAYLADLEVYLPIDDQASVEEAHPAESPVRWFTLAGAGFGFLAGLGLAFWSSADYPLVTGGKPIMSLPPFLVVAFETMILFAVIGAVVGFLWCSRLPDLTPSSAYRRDFAVDSPALLIRSVPTEEMQTRAERVLREAGALEVWRVPRERRGVLEEVP